MNIMMMYRKSKNVICTKKINSSNLNNGDHYSL